MRLDNSLFRITPLALVGFVLLPRGGDASHSVLDASPIGGPAFLAADGGAVRTYSAYTAATSNSWRLIPNSTAFTASTRCSALAAAGGATCSTTVNSTVCSAGGDSNSECSATAANAPAGAAATCSTVSGSSRQCSINGRFNPAQGSGKCSAQGGPGGPNPTMAKCSALEDGDNNRCSALGDVGAQVNRCSVQRDPAGNGGHVTCSAFKPVNGVRPNMCSVFDPPAGGGAGQDTCSTYTPDVGCSVLMNVGNVMCTVFGNAPANSCSAQVAGGGRCSVIDDPNGMNMNHCP